MRPIKFRVHNPLHPTYGFAYVDLQSIMGVGGMIYDQFTGLQDGKGRDIYENDIITYVEGIELGDKTLVTAIVVYDMMFAGFGYTTRIGNDCSGYPWEGTVSHPTVIGNIHENLELIK